MWDCNKKVQLTSLRVCTSMLGRCGTGIKSCHDKMSCINGSKKKSRTTTYCMGRGMLTSSSSSCPAVSADGCWSGLHGRSLAAAALVFARLGEDLIAGGVLSSSCCSIFYAGRCSWAQQGDSSQYHLLPGHPVVEPQ